jgi:excisionase family DNA binding protein
MNWMTVKEVAKYLKLSEMMIYKLAQTGEMPASKIGSAWRFSEQEIDEWLLRQSSLTPSLTGNARTAVDGFIKGLKREFKDNLLTVIIFGSYARGEAEKGSDLDIFVALKSVDDHWKLFEKIEEIAYANTFDKDIRLVLSPVLMDETEYLTGTSPFLLNIRREGRKAA